MQHRRPDKFRGVRQPVPFNFDKPSRVRIHVLARRRKPLDGQLFEALAEPFQSRRCACIFKRKNQVDSLLGTSGGGPRVWGGGVVPRKRGKSKKGDNRRKKQKKAPEKKEPPCF